MLAQLAQPTRSGAKLTLHFEASFDASDFSSLSKAIGRIDPGFLIHKTVIQVDSAFDGSASITIGDPVSQGILATNSDVSLDIP